MTPNRPRSLVPMAHVQSVPRSIEFYARLGFEARRTHAMPGDPTPVWAWLTADGADLMVTKADGPVDPGQQAILFYLYCPDVAAYRERLVAEGLNPGPLQYPFWAPRGEFRLHDPDDYVLMVTHTGR